LLGDALKNSSQPALVRSAFVLPADQRAAIQNALNETFSAEVRINFEDSQDIICGIELTANGQKVAWSIASYLAALSKKVSDLVDTQSRLPVKAAPKPEPAKDACARTCCSRWGQMTASAGILQPAIERAFARCNRAARTSLQKLTPHEVGIVTKVSTGIATFSGLPSVGYEEIVTFPRRSAWHCIQPR
jgi:hypothetical protein